MTRTATNTLDRPRKLVLPKVESDARRSFPSPEFERSPRRALPRRARLRSALLATCFCLGFAALALALVRFDGAERTFLSALAVTLLTSALGLAGHSPTSNTSTSFFQR